MDWNRFTNRRQVASMTGMCPGVRSSGLKTYSGAITKHGNRRLRTALIELAWRCTRFQPDYPPLKKRREILLSKKATGAAKKKAIVAIGVAFATQKVKTVPAQPHDVALDYVLTEDRSFDFRSS